MDNWVGLRFGRKSQNMIIVEWGGYSRNIVHQTIFSWIICCHDGLEPTIGVRLNLLLFGYCFQSSWRHVVKNLWGDKSWLQVWQIDTHSVIFASWSFLSRTWAAVNSWTSTSCTSTYDQNCDSFHLCGAVSSLSSFSSAGAPVREVRWVGWSFAESWSPWPAPSSSSPNSKSSSEVLGGTAWTSVWGSIGTVSERMSLKLDKQKHCNTKQ